MKRNSITKKIISLVLSVLILGSCWVYAPIEAEAVNTHSVSLPRSDQEYFTHSGMGSLPGLLANGKSFYKNNNYNGISGLDGKNYRLYDFHFVDEALTKHAYCLEPGVSVNHSNPFNATDEDAACEELAKRATDAATNVKLTKDEFKVLIRKVLGYGYQHGKSIDLKDVGLNMQKWNHLKSNTTQRDSFCYAIATQILVWELCLGERDAQFNRVPVKAGYLSAYDHTVIHDDSRYKDNPLKWRIDEYYNQIVKDVKNSTPKNDENISDKTFELQKNESAKTMEVTIPDPSGVLKDVNVIKGVDGDFTTHNGKELIISIPYHYAKEGTYELEYTIKYKQPAEVTFYLPSSTQDLITASGGFSTAEDTYSFKIIIPHHHEWVPHLIVPTCTTEGLTCMMCKCGHIYTEKITPHLGHDESENSPWVIGHQATCTEPGEEVQICQRCNTVINTRVIEPTGHNGVWIIETEPTADHDGQMVLHCTKCGNRTETKSYQSHNHKFGYTAVVRDATCVSEGLAGKFCELCGVCYETSAIPAGHSESLVWVTTIQPTCSAAGEASGFCADCGDIVTTKPIDAKGHSEGIWMTSVSPFCGLEGEEICICDQCGEIIDSHATEALSHDEGVWKVTKDPTCELDGEKAKSCTRCGHVIETEAIDAIGHDEGVWKIDIEATADLDGSMSRYCTRCSMVLETKTFTLHSHEEGYKATLLQPTCTREGEKGTACKICNAVYSTETVPELGHDYSEFYTGNNSTHSKSCSRCHYVYTVNCEFEVTESYEATCTTPGYRTSKCTVCDYSYSDSFVPPYGHTLGKWESEGKSTHMRYCTDCGVMEISKHVWGEYFSNNDGDIIEEGSKTRSCIYCGESQTIGKPASIINSAFKATMTLLDFLIELFGSLSELSQILARFIELIKNY